MVQKYIYLICLLTTISLQAQQTNPNYDAALAQSLRADDYGMTSYTLVILKTGAQTQMTAEDIQKAFQSHMQNIQQMAAEKRLIVAGPLGKNEQQYRGIFILNTTDAEEIQEILKGDLAINSGLLDVETFTWYGSAALPLYLETADKIWKTKP